MTLAGWFAAPLPVDVARGGELFHGLPERVGYGALDVYRNQQRSAPFVRPTRRRQRRVQLLVSVDVAREGYAQQSAVRSGDDPAEDCLERSGAGFQTDDVAQRVPVGEEREAAELKLPVPQIPCPQLFESAR